MKQLSILLCLISFFPGLWAQQYRKSIRPTRNVILMIPDGTSIGVVSAARWYQIYNRLGTNNLALDPYICGTVKTHSSNAPIGCSAATTSCYMTGFLQQTGNVAIYPVADPEQDLVPVDPDMAYQPLTTILEAMKYEQDKATGLVVTVEFPHATPADCSSHHYSRKNYQQIASQMAYNNLDVVFGGGNLYVTDDMKHHFRNTNTILIQSDAEAFHSFSSDNKVWALFGDKNLPYDIDRDPSLVPSLAEMTEKAIERLNKNENGFFLMVEGSQIDYGAHANDPLACITEYLAFDKAVKIVMDFAEKNGETTVIILPDHGNSGFTIGNRDLKNYAKRGLDDLFRNISLYKKTSRGLETILLKTKPEKIKSVFKKYTDIELTDDELKRLLQSRNYKEGDYMEISNSVNMVSTISHIMASRTYFGFTSGGHTGEEVFLGAYHPNGDIPLGMNTNIEINRYLFDVAGLTRPLPDITNEIYAKHIDVFKGFDYKIDESSDLPDLIVKRGRNVLRIPASKSVVYLNDKPIGQKSVIVYIDKNKTFYLPRKLVDLLK